MKRRTAATRLSRQLGIPKGRGLEAVVKARLIAAIVPEVEHRGFTHAELAVRSGLPRSAVTGILVWEPAEGHHRPSAPASRGSGTRGRHQSHTSGLKSWL